MGVPFATAVLGGAVGAVLTQAATFFRDWLNKREEGRFTALALALQLESYASECTEPIFELSNYASSSQHTHEPSGSVPLLSFSDDTNWRALGPRRAEVVLGLQVRVGAAQASLNQTWEHGGPVSAWGEAADVAVELGAAAIDIAANLRRSFGLGPRPTVGDFDIQQFFRDRLVKLREARERSEAESAKFWTDALTSSEGSGG